jgi:DNA adenine methylase Dam
MPSSRRRYKQLRSSDPSALSANQRTIRFLYLSRHCFNGVYRENQAGQFNVPYGSKIPALHTNLQFQEFAHALRNAELRNVDFKACVADAQKNDFVYLDPPNAKRTARNRGEYGSNAFGRSAIERFVECLHDFNDRGALVDYGVFSNAHTLEVDLFQEDDDYMAAVIETLHEGPFGTERHGWIDEWAANPAELDIEKFLSLVETMGKGRFAQRLAGRIATLDPPAG